ncbi:hypothetical protein WMF45_47540 [Sorangium sp. So ce448]|uniref:hypothetical protein n=1 Tax=Sorangium sp. So ce448 TaxID=3133314 RepID=UPI003F63B10D
MGQKTDLVLGATLDLVAENAVFKNQDNQKTAATVSAGSSGNGEVTLAGGASRNDAAGLHVLDHNGNRVVSIRKGAVTPADIAATRVFLDGEFGNAILGGGGADGDLVLRSGTGGALVHISAAAGAGEGNTVNPANHPEANIRINGFGIVEVAGASSLCMKSPNGATTVELQGVTGRVDARDIRLGAGQGQIQSLLDYIRKLEERITRLEGGR